MTDIRDDPRDVLALLNSLGFVGITAPQLKAFMKDLKIHRKIKEREKQQWKEETRKKILTKQECVLNKILRDTIAAERSNSLENVSALNNSSQQEDPLVRIKVHCASDDEENTETKNRRSRDVQDSSRKRQIYGRNEKSYEKENREVVSSFTAEGISVRHERQTSKSYDRPKFTEFSTDSSQYVTTERENFSSEKLPQGQTRQNREARVPLRPLSAPEFTNKPTVIPKERSKSVASDSTGLANARSNPSRCSARSQTKSFIRPWRLHPEAQRAASLRKSDPVALYQQYQERWKQISFPGEEQHAHVRWAIREKMLGTDPNPRPILKKSQSLMSIKKQK